MVEVVVEPVRVAVANPQRGVGFRRVGEADDFVEPVGADVAGDECDRSPGFHGTELVVVADQADVRAMVEGVGDHLVQGVGAGHGGFVDDYEVTWAEAEYAGRIAGGVCRGELVQGVRAGADGVAKFLRRARRRGEGEHPPAGVAPRVGQHPHGGGLARAGGREGELQPPRGLGERAHHVPLTGVKSCAAQRGLQVRLGDGVAAVAPCMGQEVVLAAQGAGGGVAGGVVLGEHALPVAATQHGWLVNQCWWLQGEAPVGGESGVDDVGDQPVAFVRREPKVRGLPVGFGLDVPAVEVRVMRFNHPQRAAGQRRDIDPG